MEKKDLELLPSSMVPRFARGLNILVVDSDTTSLMYLASMLEQYSYKVTTTEFASIALSMIQKEKDRFNLVMANVNMPDMDSLCFLRVLTEKEIPVILMSSVRNRNVAGKALAEGACFFLEKPISFDDLKYIWQHVYRKKSRNPLKESSKSELVNNRKTFREENIRVNMPNEENNNQIMEANQAFPADESSIKESQKNESSQQLTANEGKRSWEEGGGGEGKEKKRRKLDSEEDEETDENENFGVKRPRRIVWTPELHLKFTAAISALGDKKARPKLILQMMKEPHLTIRQIASHLQKYKSQVRRISDNGTIDLPSTLKSSSATCTPGSLPTIKSYEFAGAGTSGSSTNVLNAGKSPIEYFSEGNQEMNVIEVPKPPAGSDLPVSSVNYQPSSEYADLLKLLDGDEDEEHKAGLVGGPNPSDLDRYCGWLTEALQEDSQLP